MEAVLLLYRSDVVMDRSIVVVGLKLAHPAIFTHSDVCMSPLRVPVMSRFHGFVLTRFTLENTRSQDALE